MHRPEVAGMSQRWRSISEEQLSRMAAQGTYSGTFFALERVRKIRKTAHTPAIFYDKLDGFMVLDEDDPEQIKRIAGLRQRFRRISRP